jgi:hypothetical protein
MNPWAVVALVTGILPLFPVAVAAGITALVQNSRRQLRGTGLAIAGLVLSGCWVLGAGVLALGYFLGDESDGDLGRVAYAGSTTVGTCLTAPDEEDFIGTPVGCDRRHDAEVYLVRSLAHEDDPWPGYSALKDEADDACYDEFDRYVGQAYEDSDYDYGFFFPDEAEWRSGERRVVCVVLPWMGDSLRGSARGKG